MGYRGSPGGLALAGRQYRNRESIIAPPRLLLEPMQSELCVCFLASLLSDGK